jgi:hypothetical protein
MFRRSFLERVPLWDENLITHEDYLYLFRLSLENPRLVHVPQAAVLYRQHGAQSTGAETVSKSRATDRLNVLVQMRKELEGRKSGLISAGLFAGRFAQAFDFLESAGEDMRPWQGYRKTTDPVWKMIYRIYNKRARMKTASDWEPMHGISKNEEHFRFIVNSCING